MQMTPYLTFNGNCREALKFYADLFGGTLDNINTWDAESIKNFPDATTDHIMHGSVNTSQFSIAGSDQFGEMYSPAGNISLMLEIEDLSDAQAKFDALAQDGQIMMPFAETFWADGYGFCADRFGILWQINCTGSKAMQP